MDDGRLIFGSGEEVPYGELDPPVVDLVRVLNEEFDGPGDDRVVRRA